MEKIVIIGNGGHAKVVADVIASTQRYEVVGCTSSSNTEPIPGRDGGIPYLGDDGVLDKLFSGGVTGAIVAVGDNTTRKKLYESAEKIGFTMITAASPFTYISPSVSIGKGSIIMPGVVVHPDTVIGNNVIVNTNASIDHDCVIGDHSHVAPGCNLAGKVHLEEGVFLGIGTKIIPATSIGEWSVVGAGGTVIKPVPANVLAVGIPAKAIKNYL